MITAHPNGLVRFVVEMKNFIPRWLHFVPRFSTSQAHLEMWLAIIPQSFKIAKWVRS